MYIITICYEGIEWGAEKKTALQTGITQCASIVLTQNIASFLPQTYVLQAYIGVGKQVGAISRYKRTMSLWIAHLIPGS